PVGAALCVQSTSHLRRAPTEGRPYSLVDREACETEMSWRMTVATIALPYSRLATEYDATIGAPFFRETRDRFERLVQKYGLSFRSAADIGCGTGLFARYLQRSRKIPVFAVDLSESMLRMASKNCRETDVKLLRQDMRYLTLPEPVDLIMANFD